MENGDACLSMEQGGMSLDALIEKCCDNDQNFTAFETASVTMGIARALSYLHNYHKLLHGDIKSGNVLVAGIGFLQGSCPMVSCNILLCILPMLLLN